MRWIYLRASFLFWFGGIWLTVGLVLATVGASQLLLGDGDVVLLDARVTGKGRDADREGEGARFWLRYAWDDADGERAGLLTVDEPTWRLREEGDAIVVERRADGSARVRGDDEGDAAGAIFLAVGGALAAVGAAIAVAAFRRAGRRVRVLAEGRVTHAVVEAVDRNLKVRINGRNPQFFIFRYRDEIGRDRTGRSPDLPRALEDRWREGDSVRVVFDPLDPDQCEADVFELRG